MEDALQYFASFTQDPGFRQTEDFHNLFNSSQGATQSPLNCRNLLAQSGNFCISRVDASHRFHPLRLKITIRVPNLKYQAKLC